MDSEHPDEQRATKGLYEVPEKVTLYAEQHQQQRRRAFPSRICTGDRGLSSPIQTALGEVSMHKLRVRILFDFFTFIPWDYPNQVWIIDNFNNKQMLKVI